MVLHELPLSLFAAFGIGWLAWGIWWFVSIPRPLALVVCCLITVILPPAVGWVCRYRYRLWHYFAWITLIAAELALFTQWPANLVKSP